MIAQAWLPLATLTLFLAACSGEKSAAPASAVGPAETAAGARVEDSGAGTSAGSETRAEAGAGVQAGAGMYGRNCIACHQKDARGIPGVYPSLAGSPVVLGDPKELAAWVIQGRRPASMPAGRYPTTMIQFGWMKPDDAAALFTYLRSNFGNNAPAVDAATVAQALSRQP